MTEQEILAAIDGLTPDLQRAYLDRVRAVVDASTYAAVQRYIEDNDEQGLIDYLSLGAMALFAELIRAVFIAGGRKPREKPPGGRPVEFDPSTAEAVQALQQQAASTVASINEAQAEAIRLTMQAGAMSQQSAAQTARDILGTTSKQTGRRLGGVVGLSGADVQAVLNAQTQLASGVPAQIKEYLNRVDRDPIFDPIARRAIKNETPVAAADIKRITDAYAARKVKTRARMLARTAGLEAYNSGFNQLYVQLSLQPKAPQSITKGWRNKGDERVRNTHEILGGVVVPLMQPFQTARGAMLMYPGDSSLGAGLNERANCRCTLTYRVVW
jgi:hypothetical protein